jgi:hypothetical protein
MILLDFSIVFRQIGTLSDQHLAASGPVGGKAA